MSDLADMRKHTTESLLGNKASGEWIRGWDDQVRGNPPGREFCEEHWAYVQGYLSAGLVREVQESRRRYRGSL